MHTHANKKKKIMVVDDDISILEISKILLESEGYMVETYTSGEHLYNLNGNRPDLILLDILLSGEDGRDICNYIKSNDKTKDIPVILFSAHIKAELGDKLQECHSDYFIPKPFDIDVLTQTIQKFTH